MIKSYKERGLLYAIFFALGFVYLVAGLTMLLLVSAFGYIMAFQSNPNPDLAWELVCRSGEQAAIAALVMLPIGCILELELSRPTKAG